MRAEPLRIFETTTSQLREACQQLVRNSAGLQRLLAKAFVATFDEAQACGARSLSARKPGQVSDADMFYMKACAAAVMEERQANGALAAALDALRKECALRALMRMRERNKRPAQESGAPPAL